MNAKLNLLKLLDPTSLCMVLMLQNINLFTQGMTNFNRCRLIPAFLEPFQPSWSRVSFWE